ncbi:hypothetical protein [Pseudomonas putida]|uniref:hypothetical protein n=1 Tax=Pseudomonas putida TaxID=303 RepID=UPI003D97A799
MPPLNATSVYNAPPRPSFANEVTAQTYLSNTLLRAGNNPHSMGDLSAASVVVSSELNSGIPFPALVSKMGSSFFPGFHDQDELNREWSLLQEQLKTRTLTHRQAWEVLSSGILRTDTGKFLCGLFTEAMVRSFPRFASLDEVQLKYLFDVLCGLPAEQWQAALGEDFRLTSAKNNGLAKRIQVQLDTSRDQQVEQIESGKLFASAHWETLKTLVQEGRQHIPAREFVPHGEDTLDGALMMLEDASEDRPSPKALHADLDKFVRMLEEKDVTQVHLPERYVTEVKALRDLLKPDDEVHPSWLEWLFSPGWLEELRAYPLWSATSHGSTPQPKFDPGWPLSSFQRFERNASFKLDVCTTGPRIPESITGKLLWVCNALDTFGQLRMDSSHISPYARTAPSNLAWKNGASDMPESPFQPTPGQSQTTSQTDPLASVTQLIATVDEWVTRNMVPWSSASATSEGQSDVVIEMESLGRFVPEVEVVREQVMGWAARLIGSGAAVWNGAGALVEANPGRVAGLFGVCVLINNILDYWSQSEPEEMVDPLQGLDLTPQAAPDGYSVVHQYMIEGIEDLFEEFPDFANEVKRLVSQSDYSDPADDPQLLENLDALLQSAAPGMENMTYQDYLIELAMLATIEADDDTDGIDGPRTETTSSSDAPTPLASDKALAANGRSKRSLDDSGMFSNIQTSESALAAHSPVLWMIEAGQRSLDADNAIGAGEEIAPGVTISQAADLFIKDFVELQTVLDSRLFVLSYVADLVAGSDLPAGLKSQLNYKTEFKVEYHLSRPDSKYRHALPDKTKRYKTFTLAELLMGQHEKQVKEFEVMTVIWPSSYTDAFKGSVENSGLWADYEKRSEVVSSQPRFFELWKEVMENKLQHLVGDYLKGTGVSQQGKDIGNKFLAGEISVRPVFIRDGKYSSTVPVTNAVFLCTSYLGRDAREGLFVFMGGNETVIESPVELFEKDGKSIEDFPALRAALSDRIPLKSLLGRDDDDFKYSQGRFVWGWNPVGMFKNYKWPYKPIEFGQKDGPNHYGESHDAFASMFNNAIYKANDDMDTMTSTWMERTADGLLGILSESLRWGAVILALPGAPTAGLAFLMGASASATQYVRGGINDDPLESNRHKSNAVIGMVAQIAAPYVSKLLGRTFSTVVDSRIAGRIFEYLRFSDILPKKLARLFPKYNHASAPLMSSANKIEKWIAPRVRNPWIIQEKVNRKLTNKLVVERLSSLGKGPQVAQKLMDRSRVLYFGGPKEGYVYRGFAMRGDIRSPKDVFAKGFKSDSGQASGYYDSNGMGAFHNGGKQGGWTYLIDGRGVEGKDVLRNMNWKTAGGAKLGSNPYQINYVEKIPGSNVLGAYDSSGRFIPNPRALNSAIEKSIPTPFVESIPFPIKNVVQNKNSTHTPIKLPQ